MKKKILIVEDEFAVAHQLRSVLESAGYDVCGIAVSVPKALVLIDMHKPGLVILDIQLKGNINGIQLAHTLNNKHIPFIYLSANSSESILTEAKVTRPYGFLVKPFREKDLLVAIDIALYRHENSQEVKQLQLATVKDHLKYIAQSATLQDDEFAQLMQEVLPFDYLTFFSNRNGVWSFHDCGFLRIHFKEYQKNRLQELSNISDLSLNELMLLTFNNAPLNTLTLYNADSFDTLAANNSLIGFFASVFNMRSLLFQPLLMSDGSVSALCLFAKHDNGYSFEHIDVLNELRPLLEPAVENVHKVAIDNLQPIEKHHNTPHPIKSQDPIFNDIIGQSSALLKVFDHIKKVSGRNTSVLILGENGTGKEKIAKSIHQLSSRGNKQFITVNCASLHAELIESELFGHEKGSFTGAVMQRLGKFEQASGGTIFLDEIGEMPLCAQVKLLRTLQQREIERIGGSNPIKVDIRIIAATNRNLEKEVAEGRFRMDLYYRLNVFPITLPPLRERVEDIPLLVAHFLKEQSKKAGRMPYRISPAALQLLLGYDWPGNIRELENFIERATVMATGEIIENVYLPGTTNNNTETTSKVKTIDEIARNHIIDILKKCNLKIYGPGGAAALLNIPPTTLSYKIKKLGIAKDLIN